MAETQLIELFTLHFQAKPETLWQALKQALMALGTTTLRDIDEQRMRASFTTSMTLTSWGEYMVATVEQEQGGTLIRVHGQPLNPSLLVLTTKWGEELHAKQIEQELKRAVEKALR